MAKSNPPAKSSPAARLSRCVAEGRCEIDDAIRETTAATLKFERDLESLVLAAYAAGARIEGTWTIEVPVATAPDWTVELRKEHGEDSEERPEHIEE